MLPEEGPGIKARRCPACGVTVARRARTCYMCGASLGKRCFLPFHIRRPRLLWRSFFRRPEARRCSACGARVGSTARTCAMCGSELPLQTERVPSYVLALLPDFLLFALVVGIVAFGWWWHGWQVKSATYPAPPTATAVAFSMLAESPSPTVTFPPMVTATSTARATLAPAPTSTPTSMPSATPTTSATPSATAAGISAPTATQPAPSSTPSPTSTALPSPTPTASSIPTQVHVVVQGDTLGEIAFRYELDVEALMQANPGLNPQRLRIGHELLIPAPGVGGDATGLSQSATGSRVITHIVQAGETLLGIAAQYAVTLNDIFAMNPDVSPQFLRVGHVLRIELGPSTATPTSTPLPTTTPLPYSAPVLLGPPEGEAFQGPEAKILLWWMSVGMLSEEEWYAVRLLHAGRQIEDWTRAPSWRVPRDLYPGLSGSPLFQWDVVVKRAGGAGEEEPISAPSSARSFLWQ